MAAGARTKVQLCGRLSVEIAGERVEGRLRGRQGRMLFAYLAANRARPISRDELVDALWPFEAPPRPGAALSTQLSLLRGARGAARVQGRSEIQLVLPADAWVDVEAAAEAVGRAEAATARGDWQDAWSPAQAALAIAERGFLPGHDAPWIDARRRDLEDLMIDALETVATVGVRIGGSELAIAERAARRLIDLAPLRESGHVALMQVQQARGNAAEGLRVYEELRSRLRDELGAVPGTAAQRVHMTLLAEPEPVAPHLPETAPATVPLPALLEPAPRLSFVGRRRDLARLELLLDRATELPRQLALLAGEPGIGKTRLLHEFGRHAHERGAVTLFGRADEDRLVPYGPFLEAIRHYVAHAPDDTLRRATELGQGELAVLLPELRGGGGSGVRDTGGDPALARYRLFDAISGLLVDAAAEQPVVLLLDDLHWADEPTLLLLKHVLRAPRQRGLLVVATYRDAELHRARARSEALADLQRDVPSERVPLRGLARPDVHALARESIGTEPGEALVASIHEETEGNPFFAIELARHLAEADPAERAGLPEGVREVILRRLAHLGQAAEQALRHAAVLGREFELDVLERVGALSGDELVDALDEAVAARVLTEVPQRPERYSFAHALIRTTLYGDLTGARRVRLHQRAGEALLELSASGRAVSRGEVAAHLLAALPRGDAARALDQALVAAAEATEQLRYEDAARQLSGALRALDRHLPADAGRRMTLLIELGHAQRRSGRMPEARVTFLEAIAAARELADRRVLAEAVLGYGGGWFESAFMDDTTVALLEEALGGVDGDGVLHLELLSRLAKALYYSEDPRDEERRVRLSAEAMAMAERLGDDRARLIALEGRHFALTSPENLDERIATARWIIELAAAVGDRERDLLGRYFLIADLVEADRIEEADREIAVYGELAAAARLQLHRWYHARFLAMRALLAGRLQDAAELSRQAFALGQPVEPRTATMHFGTQTWLLHRIEGRLGELEEAVRGFVAEYPRVPAWRAGLAHVLLAQGCREEAADVFREFTASRFENVPRDAIWSLTMGLAADLVAAGLGGPEDARLLYELLSPYADRNAVTGEVIVCSGPVALYAGAMALAMGDPDTAIPLLENALERSARIGARPFEAAAAEALSAARAARPAA